MFEAMGFADAECLDAMCSQSRAFFRDVVPGGGFRFWMAESENQVVGAIGMVIHSTPPSPENLLGTEAYLMNLVVLPEHRRRGVGNALLRHAMAVAVTEGISVASVHACQASRALCERSGFAVSSSLPEMRIDLCR
jgi:ribosomal protein S18 acetylase RimI-like enzyme